MTKEKGAVRGYLHAYRMAFPYTIPVLTGYIFIGIAFGVLFAEKGYNGLWAMLMSLVVLAGAGQYLAVNFFVPGFSIIEIISMTLLVNIRHIFYGISLLEKFKGLGLKRWYLIFSLTDESYSLLCTTDVPADVDRGRFLFAISSLNQSYWVIGSGIGGALGMALPFSSEGIDFAMTALFLVIFTEQAFDKKNHIPQIIGVACAFVSLQIFGVSHFIMPAMLSMIGILLIGRSRLTRRDNNAN